MKTKLTTTLVLGALVVAAAIGISALAQPGTPADGSSSRPRQQMAPDDGGQPCPAQRQSAENGSRGDREFLVREDSPPDDRRGPPPADGGPRTRIGRGPDAGPPRDRGSADGGRSDRPRPEPGSVLPPFVRDQLRLSDDQTKKIADLEGEVKTKLKGILTDDQMKRLEDSLRRGPPQPRDSGFGQSPRGGQAGGPPDRSRGPDDRRAGPGELGRRLGPDFGGPPDGMRSPPMDDRRGPPMARDARRPSMDDRRSPPPDGLRSPPPDDRRGPPMNDDRRFAPSDRRSPPPDDRRGPPMDDDGGPPPRRDRRGPPDASDSAPPESTAATTTAKPNS